MQALPQTIHLEMDEQKTKQLKAMLGICQGLGAETRYHPEHRYFTAMVWTGWDTPCGMGEALAVQQKIQRTAAQYPAVVCYCFDPFSTLVYTLEVEPNGTIRQKRTYFDRQNDDLKDAEKFLKEWQKVVSERLTESDREKAEKSKVLRLQEFEQLRQDDIRIHTGDLAGQRLVDVLVSDLMETAA